MQVGVPSKRDASFGKTVYQENFGKRRKECHMKRWDRLVDLYMEEYEAAGRAAESAKGTRRELERWGSWLKNLRPRPALEEVNADLTLLGLKIIWERNRSARA